jgi:hypothetical protein
MPQVFRSTAAFIFSSISMSRFSFRPGDAAAAEPASEGAGRIPGCAEVNRCFAFSSDMPHYIAFFEQITIILNITSFIVPE